MIGRKCFIGRYIQEMCKYAYAYEVESYCKEIFLTLCDWEELIRAAAWRKKLSRCNVVMAYMALFIASHRGVGGVGGVTEMLPSCSLTVP